MKFLTEYFNSGSIKQQNKKRMGALLICATAVLLCIALIVLMIASIAIAVKNRASADEEDPSDSNGIPTGYTTTTPDASQLSVGNLLLLDATHPYTGEAPSVIAMSNNRPKDDTLAEDPYLYWMYDTVNFSLTREALDAFAAMVTDFYAATKDNNLYVAAAYVTGGTSAIHQSGNAVTLHYYTEAPAHASIFDAENQKPVETYKWIYNNAAKYGFVLASEDETQQDVFRYVGVAHASAMEALSADSFPAYLEALKTRCNKPTAARTVTTDTGRYKIYYQAAAADTPVYVPETNTYTISGNNVDGYIITETVSTQKK